ncbi:hypothetical protein G9U51_07820 [Calidifontibacter sp. DB0510]|uniref:Uncharacterized protein n=1 Tax=Metallococcus carri TaxID=1656884 RepID=A0A967EAA6_9MICO|nr:hypothetical protein [Metallococcus carri]NHN55684.1 hypothetical protein [Metallococcus carri]NOP38132.1 hypothetical protein [Calidifontibacter sp. DB2511S]
MRRLDQRWHELPLDRASSGLPQVYAVAADLAARVRPGVALPKLGPQAVIRQLQVVAWDACAAGHTDVGALLADLRRGLA